MEAERLRPPSPPPVVHYSEHEASILSEQLKGIDYNVFINVCTFHKEKNCLSLMEDDEFA